MSVQFCYDVETCSTEDNAIVLSAALVWFDPEETDITFDQLVERTLYVKFKAKEQAEAGRKVSKDTIEWWNKQGPLIKDLSFKPSKKDLTAAEGIGQIRAYIKEHGDKNSFVWARGSLDQRVTESLCKTFDLEPIQNYNMWMDVRTAIRLLKETSKVNGYCDIPNFNYDVVFKHSPIDDIALDVLMLVQGV
ncbi:MAG: 3'-5' exoribonuclease domain-containing protein [Desulfuromonadaceae bacterium]